MPNLVRLAINAGSYADIENIITQLRATPNQPNPFTAVIDDESGDDSLIYAIIHRANSENGLRIIRTLLQTRVANHPIVDINAIDNAGRTALHHLLNNHFISNENKFTIFELMMDLRDARGRLLINMSYCRWTHGTPLMDAVRIGHIDIVRALLDLRKEDGSFAVNVNEARSNSYHTALDVAYMHLMNDQLGRSIEQSIRARGGFRQRDINPAIMRAYRSLPTDHPLHPDFDPRGTNRLIPANYPVPERIVVEPEANNIQQPAAPIPQAQVAPPRIQAEVQQFIDNSQNTHDSKVTISVNASISKLRKRYNTPATHEALREIYACLNRWQGRPEQKAMISRSLDRIAADPSRRSGNNATLSEALALVWRGIHDKTALTANCLELSPRDILLREESLLMTLHKAQTEYPGHPPRPACFVGTMNLIIQSLDKIHPDVDIITGDIISAGTARCQQIVKDELVKKDPETKKSILQNWYNTRGSITAQKFLKEMAIVVEDTLDKEFETLLTHTKRQDIVAHLPEMEKPILHKPLNLLMDLISNLADTNLALENYNSLFFYGNEQEISLDDINENAVVLINQGDVKRIIFVKVVENKVTNRVEKNLLSTDFNITLTKQDEADFAGTVGQFKITNKTKDLKTIVAYKTKMNTLLETAMVAGGQKSYQLEAISALKAKVNQARIDYNGANGDTVYEALHAEYKALNQLIAFDETIEKLTTATSPQKILKSICKYWVQKGYKHGIENSFASNEELYSPYQVGIKCYETYCNIAELLRSIGDDPNLKDRALTKFIRGWEAKEFSSNFFAEKAKEFQNLQNLDQLWGSYQLLIQSYQSTNPQRVDALLTIQTSIKEIYGLYADSDKPAEQCVSAVYKKIIDIRNAVASDHKQHSWTRFLGPWQPQSKLVNAIDKTFRLNENSTFKLEQALQSRVEKSSINPFLSSFEPKRKALRLLLNKVHAAEGKSSFKEILEDWKRSSSDLGKTGAEHIKYTNGELITIKRNRFFNSSAKSETEMLLDRITRDTGIVNSRLSQHKKN